MCVLVGFEPYGCPSQASTDWEKADTPDSTTTAQGGSGAQRSDAPEKTEYQGNGMGERREPARVTVVELQSVQR